MTASSASGLGPQSTRRSHATPSQPRWTVPHIKRTLGSKKLHTFSPLILELFYSAYPALAEYTDQAEGIRTHGNARQCAEVARQTPFPLPSGVRRLNSRRHEFSRNGGVTVRSFRQVKHALRELEPESATHEGAEGWERPSAIKKCKSDTGRGRIDELPLSSELSRSPALMKTFSISTRNGMVSVKTRVLEGPATSFSGIMEGLLAAEESFRCRARHQGGKSNEHFGRR